MEQIEQDELRRTGRQFQCTAASIWPVQSAQDGNGALLVWLMFGSLGFNQCLVPGSSKGPFDNLV